MKQNLNSLGQIQTIDIEEQVCSALNMHVVKTGSKIDVSILETREFK